MAESVGQLDSIAGLEVRQEVEAPVVEGAVTGKAAERDDAVRVVATSPSA